MLSIFFSTANICSISVFSSRLSASLSQSLYFLSNDVSFKALHIPSVQLSFGGSSKKSSFPLSLSAWHKIPNLSTCSRSSFSACSLKSLYFKPHNAIRFFFIDFSSGRFGLFLITRSV